MDITLNIVKVQNFDNTIVTIPPYSLVSGSFINWRGMTESGGRRIMREYALKLDYIQPCTPEFLEKMKKFDADLADFITEKQKQAAEGKVANTDNPAGLVNGTIDTNVGLLRAYMTLYLKRHPFISKDLLLMVRTLAPTENGLPVQIYCFSANKNWPSYESIQAEIMEHFVSVLPEFGLYPFQNPTARDYVISGLIESGKDLSTVDGIPWHSVLPKEEKV
jgi:miniconductance mechanosensitive channel